MSLIRVTEKGFFCERGGFHIDPWGEVDVALITHGHADHARRGPLLLHRYRSYDFRGSWALSAGLYYLTRQTGQPLSAQ